MEGFSDLITSLQSRTLDTYRGLPLAEATDEERQHVIKHIARQVDRLVHKDSIIKDASPGNNRRCAEEDYDWLHDDTMNPPWRIKAVGAQVKFSHTSSTL